MPSVNKVLISLQNLRFAVPVINTLYKELQLSEGDLLLRSNKTFLLKDSLVLNKVSFRYPKVDRFSLQDITINIRKGTSVGFIGGSGAGKSTLIDIILGLLKPESGSMKMDGVDILKNLRSWQDLIGYVPQTIYLTDDTLRRNIAFGLANEQIDESAIWNSIRSAQLESYVNELPKGLDTIVGERGIRLSGGQRQRIGIARALYHDPEILVLDEATSSLDTKTEQGVMNTVSALQGKKTVLIVAHRLSTIKHCDYLFRLDNGKIINSGKANDVLDSMPNIDTIN
jgi:ABC-type multidrug transport system fused ATPase/permease subunit